MVKRGLRKLFGLHAGEGGEATLFCLIALLWGIGGYGTLTLSEGMLLQNVGAAWLPYTYLFVALSLFTCSTLLIYALNHLSVKQILLLVLTLALIAQALFYLLYPPQDGASAYWIVYKVYGWMMPVLIYICFWAFVDQYFDLQTGKRLFALFNAMLFLGDAIGGATVSYGIPLLQVKGLLLLYSCLLLASAFCIITVSKRLSLAKEEPSHHHMPLSSKSLVKTILKSRYTLLLLVFYFSMQMLAIVTEFTYMEQFENSQKSLEDAHQLTQFMGTIGMCVSLCNMGFGMFFYSRLVRKLGVNNIIIIAPLCFALLFLFWLGTPALTVAVFGVFAREGMIYSLDDNNLNLLLAGVPSRIKNQVRFSVESFFEPAGMLLAASLLLFLQPYSKALGLILASSALIFVFFLRSSYTKAIFKNLVSSHLRIKQQATKWFTQLSAKERKKAEFVLLYGLKQQGEKEQLLAFAELLRIQNKTHLPHLINHVGRLSLPSKLAALALFEESIWVKDEALLKRLRLWMRANRHPAFTSALYLYFARQGLLHPEEVHEDLTCSNLTKKAAAIITLKKEPAYATAALKELRLLLDSDPIDETVMALKIIGIEEHATHADVLLPYLRHASLAISRQAAHSLQLLAKNDNTLSCKELILQYKQAQDKQVRDSLLEAISCCIHAEEIPLLLEESRKLTNREKQRVITIITEMGPEALSHLHPLIKNHKLKELDRLLAAKIAIMIDPLTLKDNLVAMIQSDLERAYFYDYHAHTIQQQIPEQNLYMLTTVLKDSAETIVSSIIQMISLSGGIAESEILACSLKSRHPKIRATAYETLEKITPSALFPLLSPFLYPQESVEERAHHYLRKGGMPLSLTQLIKVLLRSANPIEAMVALQLKAQLKVPGWREAAEKKATSTHSLSAAFAKEVLHAP